jgi:hypothetical protein
MFFSFFSSWYLDRASLVLSSIVPYILLSNPLSAESLCYSYLLASELKNEKNGFVVSLKKTANGTNNPEFASIVYKALTAGPAQISTNRIFMNWVDTSAAAASGSGDVENVLSSSGGTKAIINEMKRHEQLMMSSGEDDKISAMICSVDLSFNINPLSGEKSEQTTSTIGFCGPPCRGYDKENVWAWSHELRKFIGGDDEEPRASSSKIAEVG